jgi:hypothetical protein
VSELNREVTVLIALVAELSPVLAKLVRVERRLVRLGSISDQSFQQLDGSSWSLWYTQLVSVTIRPVARFVKALSKIIQADQ